MEKLPLISIIVPVYKVEAFLDECVNSIVHQTYRNLEIILVDDGSPDNCPNLCDNWSKKDTRIKVIHKQNGGLSSARNEGIRTACGEYLSFVDSDDFIDLNAIEVLYNGICKDKTIAISSGRIYRYKDGKYSPFKKEWEFETMKKFTAREFMLKAMDMKVSYTVWNKLYKSSLFEHITFMEGRNNEDTLFIYDISKELERKAYSVIDIPQYVYFYRLREDSICTSSKKPLYIDIINNYQCMMDDCKGKDKQLHDILYRKYIAFLYIFSDLLIVNKIWFPLYFSKYQSLLRQVPLKHVMNVYGLKDIINVQLIKRLPSIRKLLKQILMR